MFLPLIIAILLGLTSPANTNCNHNNNSTVTTNDDPGSGDDPKGNPGGDTGGENGHLPPPKP
ncbi:hypothetical protein [Pedobacter metabolipauper]|uniref:Uncharacterized protein n=1 Tax=Pedobacter metabolipauper TaxID=425513 RepID=A0A4R6SUI6_9SPHI|nr:hypothetical protein [Pedobacter metabolipauper]TDQ09458.1 hypothetical protein ATK78_1612 [Pedobacter metabolipauper]